MTSRVLIVDDHPLFRRGLQQLLAMSEHLQFVGEVDDGEGALEAVETLNPDLILMDLNMAKLDGLKSLQALQASGQTVRVVMLTVSDAEQDVIEALRAGAVGYLLKDMEPEALLKHIEQVAQGEICVSPRLTSLLARALSGRADPDGLLLESLTRREKDILMALARGMSNKMIARHLGISEGTVKVHVKHLLKKLDVRSRVEAAVWAVNKGLT